MSAERGWKGAVLDVLMVPVVVVALAWARWSTRRGRTRDWNDLLVERGGTVHGRVVSRIQRAVLARVRRMVPRLAGKVPWRAVCLEQSLAASGILRCVGIPSRLRFGVSLDDAAFAAHAWLESRGGIVVGGREAARFRCLDPSPSKSTQ